MIARRVESPCCLSGLFAGLPADQARLYPPVRDTGYPLKTGQ
jgi:hypothetical protein